MKFIKHFFSKGSKSAGKVTHAIYIILRIIVVVMLVDQLIDRNMGNIMLLLLTLLLFEIPYLLEKLLKIQIPNTLEIIILSFIFSATVLGELSDFYGYFSLWDTALHALSGFLAGGVGFSLVYLLNKNTKTMNLTPLLVALVSFCFSMTVGVFWEFIEFSADQVLQMDMQKDNYVDQINSVKLSEDGNTVYKIKDIQQTTVTYKDEHGNTKEYVMADGYLDIGILDTMKDLFVNFIGALVFSIFGYLYTQNDYRKFTFIRNFIPRKKGVTTRMDTAGNKQKK